MGLRTKVLLSFLIVIIASVSSCIELVDTEYSYKDNLIFIDAYALTEEGLSTVSISKSNWNETYAAYSTILIPNAKVQFDNTVTGVIIDLEADATGVYVSPPDFTAKEGEVWKLYIELEDGRKYESKPEMVSKAVPIDEIKSEYSLEVDYDSGLRRFVHGHRVSLDWHDPPDEENFYLWKYKTYEPLIVCETCERGVFRNGSCEIRPNSGRYFDYYCDTSCFQIQYEENLIIFDDRLSDGANILDKEIALLPFYRRTDILIEVQQLALNESAYNYFKIISDQVSASGGLNAPPPAPLLGNLFNPDDSGETVLGQFTTAGVSTQSVFIDRSIILERPISPDRSAVVEQCDDCPQDAPCVESVSRTKFEPEGWK